MGLFSNDAKVTLDTVIRFKEEINNFANTISSVSSALSNQLSSELEEASTKVSTLENLKKECYALYEQIKTKKSELERLVNDLTKQLSSIPKEIEVEKKNSDGTVSIQKKPNPEYARVKKELEEAKRKLSEIKTLSWNVFNKKSELDRLFGYAYEDMKKIESRAKEVSSSLNELQSKASIAVSSIENTCQAVQNYLSVSFYR